MSGPILPWFLSYPAAFAALALALILNIWSSGHAVLMAVQILLLFAAALWLLLGLPFMQARYREKRSRRRAAFSRMQEEGLSEAERASILKPGNGETDPAERKDTPASSDTNRGNEGNSAGGIDPGNWLFDTGSEEKTVEKIPPVPHATPETGHAVPDLSLSPEEAFRQTEEPVEAPCLPEALIPPQSLERFRELPASLQRIRELLEKEAPLSVDMAEVFCLQEGYALSEALGEINMDAEERLGRRLFLVTGERVERVS